MPENNSTVYLWQFLKGRKASHWNKIPIHLILCHGTFNSLNIKRIIKGCHFKGVEAIKMTVTTGLKGISEEYFQLGTEAWNRGTEKCIRFKE